MIPILDIKRQVKLTLWKLNLEWQLSLNLRTMKMMNRKLTKLWYVHIVFFVACKESS